MIIIMLFTFTILPHVGTRIVCCKFFVLRTTNLTCAIQYYKRDEHEKQVHHVNNYKVMKNLFQNIRKKYGVPITYPIIFSKL